MNKSILTDKDELTKVLILEEIISLLDKASSCTWIENKNGKYIYTNKYSKKILKIMLENNFDKNISKGELCVDKNFKYKKKLVRKYKISTTIYHYIYNNNIGIWFQTYMFSFPIGEEEYLIGISKVVQCKKLIEKSKKLNIVQGIDALKKCSSLTLHNEILIFAFMDTLKADGISISIYDYEKEGFVLKSKFGIAKDLDINNIYFSSNYEDKVPKTKPIKNINIDYNRFKNKEEIIQYSKDKYLQAYPINFKDFRIGILVIHYYNKPILIDEYDKLIEYICSKLSLVYKNGFLESKLKNELKVRIENEKKLKYLLETASDIYGRIIIKNGEYVLINESNNIFRADVPIVLKEILHKDDYNQIEEILNNRKIGTKVCNVKGRIVNREEIYRCLEFNFNFISNSKIIVTGVDKTKIYALEKENMKLEREILLKSKKRDFFTNLSHELKTPLNIIITATQLLYSNNLEDIKSYDDERLIKYIKTVKQNSYRLLKLINNLIDITKIERGDYVLKLGNFNVVNVVEEIVKSLKEYIGIKERKINFIKDDNEIWLSCDPEKIERIILNLVSNAIKYTEKNGVIEVEVKKLNNNAIIYVRNDGLPIKKEEALRIFGRFERIDNELTRNNEGCGIGLSLVKSIVELHGGNIHVNTEIEVGTEFILELPIKLIQENNDSMQNNKIVSNKIEKCNIEFSDIYSV